MRIQLEKTPLWPTKSAHRALMLQNQEAHRGLSFFYTNAKGAAVRLGGDGIVQSWRFPSAAEVLFYCESSALTELAERLICARPMNTGVVPRNRKNGAREQSVGNADRRHSVCRRLAPRISLLNIGERDHTRWHDNSRKGGRSFECRSGPCWRGTSAGHGRASRGDCGRR